MGVRENTCIYVDRLKGTQSHFSRDRAGKYAGRYVDGTLLVQFSIQALASVKMAVDILMGSCS